MVLRHDLNDPHTTSAAGDQRHDSDLTLNAPALAADLADVLDLRLAPDVNASSTEAIGNLEKQLAALTTLRDVCARIDQRLARAEAVSGRRDGAARDETLHDVCAQIYDRLIRVEEAAQRTEGFVADKPWDQSTIAYKRLERVEETMRLTQKSLEDSTLPEMCVNIERQLIQTRNALQRTEEALADKTLRELCQNIDARLVRTETTLQRTEGTVAEWLQELSASMTERFASAEKSIQQIERLVASRKLDQPTPQQPSVRMAVRQPGMTRLAALGLVLVTVFAMGALIGSRGGAAPEKVVAAPETRDVVAAPSVQTVAAQLGAPGAPALRANAPVSTPAVPVSAPRAQSTNRQSAPIASRPRTFVGTLSITSVPTGASVSINGKVAGKTPLRLPRQKAGSLAVQIAQDGFERWSAAVRVPADQLTQVTARLRPIAQ